jgi:type I restriction enzyme R subunit
MRPVNSMIEFKQIIGRGTRLYDGKDYFTIYDFVKAHHHFNDPEWDGEPEDQTTEGDGGTPKGDGEDKPKGLAPVLARLPLTCALDSEQLASISECSFPSPS